MGCACYDPALGKWKSWEELKVWWGGMKEEEPPVTPHCSAVLSLWVGPPEHPLQKDWGPLAPPHLCQSLHMWAQGRDSDLYLKLRETGVHLFPQSIVFLLAFGIHSKGKNENKKKK